MRRSSRVAFRLLFLAVLLLGGLWAVQDFWPDWAALNDLKEAEWFPRFRFHTELERIWAEREARLEDAVENGDLRGAQDIADALSARIHNVRPGEADERVVATLRKRLADWKLRIERARLQPWLDRLEEEGRTALLSCDLRRLKSVREKVELKKPILYETLKKDDDPLVKRWNQLSQLLEAGVNVCQGLDSGDTDRALGMNRATLQFFESTLESSDPYLGLLRGLVAEVERRRMLASAPRDPPATPLPVGSPAGSVSGGHRTGIAGGTGTAGGHAVPSVGPDPDVPIGPMVRASFRTDDPTPTPIGPRLPDEVWELIKEMKYEDAIRKRKALAGILHPDVLELFPRIFDVPGMAFFYVPAGRYRVGTPNDEPERINDMENDPYEVSLDGYWISATEVTQEAFLRIMPGYDFSANKGDQKPAHSVDYDTAIEFCRLLSAVDTTYDFCLPTEFEWEVACRAMQPPEDGPVVIDPTAEEDLERLKKSEARAKARVFGKYAVFSGSETPYPREVGSKLPNRLGLMDMHGNATEWCRKDSNIDYRKEESGGLGMSPQRGGSATSNYARCRAGARTMSSKAEKGPNIGFRIVARSKGKGGCG